MGGYGKPWRHLEAPECSEMSGMLWEAVGGCGSLGGTWRLRNAQRHSGSSGITGIIRISQVLTINQAKTLKIPIILMKSNQKRSKFNYFDEK